MPKKNIGEIAREILSIEGDHPVKIGIDGFCAAGKSTIADRLAESLALSGRTIIRACTDEFLNRPEIRHRFGRRSPEGFYRHAIDFESLRVNLLDPLSKRESRRYRTCSDHHPGNQPTTSTLLHADPNSLLIVDGLFLFVPELVSYWDYSVFIEASFETCIARARRRNQENMGSEAAVEAIYRDRYVPGYRLYLDQVAPHKLADALIYNDN